MLPGGVTSPLDPIGGGGVPTTTSSKEMPVMTMLPPQQQQQPPPQQPPMGIHHPTATGPPPVAAPQPGDKANALPPMAFLVWPPSYPPHFCPTPSIQPLPANDRFVVGAPPPNNMVPAPRFPQPFMLVQPRDDDYLRSVQQQRRPSFGDAQVDASAQSSCLICLQPTPAVSAARGVHVRALLLCSCIKMMRERGTTPVPDVRRNYVKSCRACRYWLELGIKKIEALTKSAGVNIQDLLAAQSRYWAAQPASEPKRVHEPVLGYFSPHPDDMRPRSLRKPLIDFVKKNVTQEMICDFQLRLAKVAPARRVTMEEDPLAQLPSAPVPALDHSEPRVTYDESPNDLPVPHDVDDDDDSAATPRFFNI